MVMTWKKPIDPLLFSLVCRDCGIEKTFDNLVPDRRTLVGYREQCLDCAEEKKANQKFSSMNRKEYDSKRVRKRTLQRTYGLTELEYEELLEFQGYACEICGIDIDTYGSNFPVDHDHSSGSTRGLLCGLCNRGLGQFKDSKELLAKAIDYLNSPPAFRMKG